VVADVDRGIVPQLPGGTASPAPHAAGDKQRAAVRSADRDLLRGLRRLKLDELERGHLVRGIAKAGRATCAQLPRSAVPPAPYSAVEENGAVVGISHRDLHHGIRCPKLDERERRHVVRAAPDGGLRVLAELPVVVGSPAPHAAIGKQRTNVGR
jgi:hypothetical protein